MLSGPVTRTTREADDAVHTHLGGEVDALAVDAILALCLLAVRVHGLPWQLKALTKIPLLSRRAA